MWENMSILDAIILLICCIVEIYILYDFFNNYFELREKFKDIKISLVISLIVVVILFLINLKGNAYLNLLFFPTITWIYISVFFKATIGSRVLYFIFAFFIFLGCEFLFGIILEISFSFVENKSVINLSEMPWQMLTMKMLTYILFTLVKQIVGKAKRNMSGKIFLMYLCLPIASFCIMLLTYYAGTGYFQYFVVKLLMSISFTLMLIGNMLMFYAFNRYSQEVYINMQQKALILKQKMDLSHYIQVARMNKKHEEFIHNTSHYLKVIGELARENKNENIRNIIKELDVEMESEEFSIYSKNHVLNAILTEKRELAQKKEIEFDAYVEPGVHLGKVTDLDLVTMLQNLLDNAVTASEKCEKERRIEVRIFMQNEGNFCVIKIVNTFIENIMQNGRIFLTTKKEEGIHGVGIRSVEKTAEKYNGYLKCTHKDKLFTAILLICVK